MKATVFVLKLADVRCLGGHELFVMFWCSRRGAIHHAAEAARYKHINNSVPVRSGLTRGSQDLDAAKSMYYLIDVFVYYPGREGKEIIGRENIVS